MDRERAARVLTRLHEAQGELYRGGDPTSVHGLLAPEITWHVPGDNAIAGEYHGVDEVVAYMLRRRDLAGSTMRMFPGEMLVGDGDHVGVRTDGAAVLGGVEHRWATLGLYRLAADTVAECWLLPLDPVAFDAVWALRTRS